MNAPACLGKVELLRLRDGPRCWLCDEALDFNAVPNSKKAPTIEHLIAQSLGGPSTMENLVLCHPGCNRQLGVRPLAAKILMRERRRKKRWIATLRSQ